ncbi:MAG: N-acetylmuramoyl-L-alanine amidase [Paenibacillus sp.]|nr:N-acetylmuramoyl-L-alanine amidase [Paenibacillus sp.]
MNRLKLGIGKLLTAAVLLIAAPVHTFAAQKIVVDAGHGGSDPGAVGVNGLYEKTVNLDIAFKLRDLLVQQGYEVVLTRTNDTYISLADRVEQTNKEKPALFVSVHANSHPNPAISGSLVLYYDKDYPQDSYPASDAMTALTPQSKQLASLVLQHVVAESGFVDKGLLPSAAYVIRMGEVPSILVETAFLSNKSDAALLSDDTVRQKLASGIAKGIAAYMPVDSTPVKPSEPVTPAAFSDISGHWAADAIARLKTLGLIEGGLNNRFEPDKPMTRAEWLTIADRLFHFDELLKSKPANSITSQLTFKDLSDKHWAYETFNRAIRLGYISGYEDGTVRPDQTVTRSEVAALLERMIDGPNISPWNASADFTDVPSTYWASGAIYRMKQKGILNGVSDKTFAPARNMTRAEMAAMIDRYISTIGDKSKPAANGTASDTKASQTQQPAQQASQQQPAGSGSGTGQQPAATGTSAGQQPATSGASAGQQSKAPSSNTAQQPAASGTNAGQQPATSGSNTAQQPATPSSNTAQQPATSSSNSTQQPATSSSNSTQQPATASPAQ